MGAEPNSAPHLSIQPEAIYSSACRNFVFAWRNQPGYNNHLEPQFKREGEIAILWWRARASYEGRNKRFSPHNQAVTDGDQSTQLRVNLVSTADFCDQSRIASAADAGAAPSDRDDNNLNCGPLQLQRDRQFLRGTDHRSAGAAGPFKMAFSGKN
jgi:hypothetical protein